MNRFMLTIGLMVSLFSASAQGFEPVSTFDKVRGSYIWNIERNVNGLLLGNESVSYAEVFGAYEAGEFRNYSDASSEWSAGLIAEGIVHREKFSMMGSFGFTQKQGQDMCGSMFINPGFYPVDVMELVPGIKNRQSYNVNGGLTYRLSSLFSLGGLVEFRSENLAKRKDLRHTNYLLDFSVSPSVMFTKGDLNMGLVYTFSRNSETIKAEQIGTAESTYYAFFDKGQMYGNYQGWEGSGVYLSESGVYGLPVKENSHALGLDLEYKGLYLGVNFEFSNGSIGEKDVIWYEFPSKSVSVDLGYRMVREKSQHYFRLGLGAKQLVNNENILDKVTVGGVTNIKNYGSNRILSLETMELRPEYEFWSKYLDVKAGIVYELDNSISTQVYPYASEQNIQSLGAEIDLVGHIGKFDVGIQGQYGQGTFEEDSKSFGEANATESFRYIPYYLIKKEYLVSPKMGGKLSLKYNFWRGMYLEAFGNYCHALNLTFIKGSDRWSAGLSYGWEF